MKIPFLDVPLYAHPNAERFFLALADKMIALRFSTTAPETRDAAGIEGEALERLLEEAESKQADLLEDTVVAISRSLDGTRQFLVFAAALKRRAVGPARRRALNPK